LVRKYLTRLFVVTLEKLIGLNLNRDYLERDSLYFYVSCIFIQNKWDLQCLYPKQGINIPPERYGGAFVF